MSAKWGHDFNICSILETCLPADYSVDNGFSSKIPVDSVTHSQTTSLSTETESCSSSVSSHKQIPLGTRLSIYTHLFCDTFLDCLLLAFKRAEIWLLWIAVLSTILLMPFLAQLGIG